MDSQGRSVVLDVRHDVTDERWELLQPRLPDRTPVSAPIGLRRCEPYRRICGAWRWIVLVTGRAHIQRGVAAIMRGGAARTRPRRA